MEDFDLPLIFFFVGISQIFFANFSI